MQITGNYQIFSNKNLSIYYNNKNNRTTFENPAKNNINISEQNTTSGNYITIVYQNGINQITFKRGKEEYELFMKATEILNRSIVFGVKEYKNLSTEDLEILRNYRKYFQGNDWSSIDDMLHIAKLFYDGIHRKFPNGFTLVSIGRSPAYLAKYMEFLGEDVKYCPISNLGSYKLRVTPYFVQEYKKYLDNIGLTADFMKTTKKPIVCTDYCFDGDTLRNFESLLALPEIGMDDKKMHFSSIAAFIEFGALKQKFSFYQIERMFNIYHSVFDEMPLAKDKYCSLPRIVAKEFKPGDSYDKKLKKYYENGNRFEEDFANKMMNFILAETARENESGRIRILEFWEKHKSTEFNSRQIKVINKLLNNFEGKLTVKKCIKICKCSSETASEDLKDLVNRKILLAQPDETHDVNYVLNL